MKMGTGANTSGCRFDWRNRAHYDYTQRITDRGWAWEGLRRNREFQTAWRESQNLFEANRTESRTTVIRARKGNTALGRWGILYSDSPSVDARDAAVFWRVSHILKTLAVPIGALAGSGTFRLGDMRCSTAVLLAPDDIQHVLFHEHGCGLQLQVNGASLVEPVHLLADIAPAVADAKQNLQAQALFGALRTRGHLAFAQRMPQARADRLRMVLQALDGFLADATLREIGNALFGASRVAREWEDTHRHLKDRARRAVARGRWLMSGGYMKYLK